MPKKMPPKGMHKMPGGGMMPGKKHMMPEKEMKGMMYGKPSKKKGK